MVKQIPSHSLHLNCTRVAMSEQREGFAQGYNCVSLARVQPTFTKCTQPFHQAKGMTGKCLRFVSINEVTNPKAFPRYRGRK